MWDRGMAIDISIKNDFEKKNWKKPRFERPRYGHCWTGSKTWTPASIVHKISHYWRTADAGVRIVAFRIAANTMARNGRGQIQDFFSWQWRTSDADIKKRILNLSPSVLHYRICRNWKGNKSNPGVWRPSIRGSFMDDRHRRSSFWPGPAVTIPRSLGPGFIPFFFLPRCQWPYHGLTDQVFFIPFLTWDVSDHTTDLVCETKV